MEQRLRQLLQLGQPGGTNLPPGSYLAITDRIDPALRGVEDAEEAGSIHVIEGRW